ncbi:hypothetical protein SNQ22_000709 [Cronobacter universalis]|nr:hypothetical protein [Cronobacter universalis]
MNYYFLDFQYPRKGFISGDVTFNPSMDKNYSAIHSELPADLTVEVTLHSSVRVMDVDLFSTTSTALFVSDDLKKTLNDIDVPVQFVPANVHYFDGSEVAKTYWLAHNLPKVDCLDLYSSEFAGKKIILNALETQERRMVKGIKKVVLDESNISNMEFFLIMYTYLLNPVVSQNFLDLCNKKSLKLKAIPVDEFQQSL